MVALMVPILSGGISFVASPLMLIAMGITFIYFSNEIDDIFDEYSALPERFNLPEDIAECVDYELVDDSFILAEKKKLNEEILDEMRGM